MSNKVFYGVILVLILGISVYVFGHQKAKPKEAVLGTQYADIGRQHEPQGTQLKFNSNPPSSGNHYAQPAPEGFYDKEVPDGNLLHNLEHGYILVAYRPDLSADQIQKLKNLFTKSFSNPKFQPTKAVVAPRPGNPAPISLASWTWTINLNSYDENTLTQFYLQHVSKSPEGAAS